MPVRATDPARRRPVDPTRVRLGLLAVFLVLVVAMVLLADPARAAAGPAVAVSPWTNLPTILFTVVVVAALVVRTVRRRGRLPRTRDPHRIPGSSRTGDRRRRAA